MQTPAIETELKFQVPRGHRGALALAVTTVGARTTRLQAVYADTAGRHLAAAGMALRLRKEGGVWVQTLKGRGDGLASRFEHEVLLAGVRGLPTLDASLHAGTALAGPLQRALRAGGALLPVYRTDIQRLHRRLRHQGALIELALDRGHLIAGDQRLPVHEIEFELISGPVAALPALAARWAQRHALWWDVRTKSERGFWLALGMPEVPAVRGAAHAAWRGNGGAAATVAHLRALLAHALPNAAALAGGAGGPAHRAELRAALQGLAAALPAVDADAAAQARQLGAELGATAAVPALARSTPATALWLRVLALTLQSPPPAA